MMKSTRSTLKGFTLVELAVVIVIIGVLAAFAVPKFRSSVERSKCGEAYNYCSALRSAQERYHALNGTYADAAANLDMTLPNTKYFTASAISGNESTWSIIVNRLGAASGYGNYCLNYDENGKTSTSNIPVAVDPRP
jgi:type IV pilus assembly protein PilE